MAVFDEPASSLRSSRAVPGDLDQCPVQLVVRLTTTFQAQAGAFEATGIYR